MLKKALILLLFLFALHHANATHNRAGEITYKQTGPLTFEITLITFTDPTTLAHQQRTELYFSFSDNTQDTFPRVSETIVGTNISKNAVLILLPILLFTFIYFYFIKKFSLVLLSKK